jgi:hypothetical protein
MGKTKDIGEAVEAAFGARVQHMWHEWSGYAFDAAPAVRDRKGGRAGRRCRGRFLARL